MLMSHAAIAQCMDIAERTVRNAIDTLKEAKFIRTSKSGKSNVYELNSRTSWQGKRGARTAAFHADVVIIEKEQVNPGDSLIDESNELKQAPVFECESGNLFEKGRK